MVALYDKHSIKDRWVREIWADGVESAGVLADLVPMYTACLLSQCHECAISYACKLKLVWYNS